MEQHADVREFLDATLKAMGLTIQIDVEDTADSVRLQLSGDGADVLLRRRAETLDALQHIVNTAFRRDSRYDDAATRHYVVDALGYRKDKEAELRQMAKFLMEKARTSGVPQEMGPLNPYHRRIVHMTVSEDPTCSSESAGDAFMKSVYISAKK
jgi:spoIIIJ-associated protein